MKAKKLLLTVVMACLAMASVQAKNIYYVKVNGTGDGTSWSNAAGNIQDMIDKAVAGDEVWVAAGTYIPTTQTDASDDLSRTFLMKDGVNLYGGFAGSETNINDRAKSDIDSNGKVEPWEFTNETILSGKLDGTTDVWTQVSFFGQAWKWSISGSNANCKTVVTCGAEVINDTCIDGFYVIGSNGSNGVDTHGKTIIQNCNIAYNINSGYGVYNVIGVVTNSYIGHNVGIGVYNGTGTVSNCIIDSNVNSSGLNGNTIQGGGILNYSGDIINCVIINNQVISYYGNSYMNYGVNPEANGGGIYNYSSGKIDKCLVMNNTVFSYNTATAGTMLSASAHGGGIYNKNTGGIVSNCCVFNNTTKAVKASTYSGSWLDASGGGITSGSIYNSTVDNNMSNNSASDINGGSNCLYRFTLNSLTQIFVRPTTFIGIATNQNQVDEILNSDWRLKEGSQYIDAGSLENLPDWLINGTDLAGNPRTHDGKISMGAYEYDPSYTNIPKLQQQGIAVFPNPASDFITISGLQPNEVFYVFNINGQQLFSGKATSETQQISIGHLPAGIYFVKTSNGQTLKWIKK